MPCFLATAIAHTFEVNHFYRKFGRCHTEAHGKHLVDSEELAANGVQFGPPFPPCCNQGLAWMLWMSFKKAAFFSLKASFCESLQHFWVSAFSAPFHAIALLGSLLDFSVSQCLRWAGSLGNNKRECSRRVWNEGQVWAKRNHRWWWSSLIYWSQGKDHRHL